MAHIRLLAAGTRRSPAPNAQPPALDVLRVFTDGQGRFGNPLGVFLDGCGVPTARRQAIAAELGYSETVFVDDPQRGELRIYTPAAELPLAGHPLVGIASLLMQTDPELRILRPPAGEVKCWRENDIVWIQADTTQAPPWAHLELDDPQDVENLAGPPAGHDAIQVWAWQDQRAGHIRARVFASRFNVAEDEACGSASMLLCQRTRRPLTILHGRGSIIHVRPGPGGTVELGGRVQHGEQRPYTLS